MGLKTALLAASILVSGSVQPFSAKASTFETIYTFSTPSAGSQPNSTLVRYGSILLGTTSAGGGNTQGGTVFSINPQSGKLMTLHAFTDQPDGAGPSGQVVVVGQSLYGVTTRGGTAEAGTLYKVDLTSNAETLYFDFGAQPSFGSAPVAGLAQFRSASLFGSTTLGPSGAAIFRVDLTEGTVTADHTLESGGQVSAFVRTGQILQGVAPGGGNRLDVVAYEPKHKLLETEITLKTGCCNSLNRLTLNKAILYGTTSGDQAQQQYGTVFEVPLVTDQATTLHKFKGSPTEGAGPISEVTLLKGKLYGVTEQGGAFGFGTVYQVDLTTGAFKTLYSFMGAGDGEYPHAGLVASDGSLYGTTWEAPQYGNGTIFKLTP